MELLIKIDEEQKKEIGTSGFARISIESLSVSYDYFSKETQEIVRKFFDNLSACTVTDEEDR